MKIYSLLIAALLVCSTDMAAQKQKFGHINSGNLLELLPEVKNADAELGKLRDKLMQEMETKLAAFQERYQKAVQLVNSGELSPKQQQEKEQQIRSEQETLQKFEQSIQAQIAQKREELLQPILTKVDNAIQEVAKEGGYSMVFDTSTGGLLFAADSEDLMAKVKAKLGI